MLPRPESVGDRTVYKYRRDLLSSTQKNQLVKDFEALRLSSVVHMPTVSVIIPAYNALPYILQALESIRLQEMPEGFTIEVSVRDDGSIDGTYETVSQYLASKDWGPHRFVISRAQTSGGPGIARNAAIEQSSGEYLCFHDADDVSTPTRIKSQLECWLQTRSDLQLIGSQFTRDPPDATWHYASFVNSLSHEDLILKSYRELTLIQTTWFISRQLMSLAGPYRSGLGEDLDLFHRILDIPGVVLRRCDEALVVYRHVGGSLSSRTPRKELVRIRVAAFERRVLQSWPKFHVWGAGRDGRTFFEMLSDENRRKIKAFVDVDANKIQSGFHHSGFIIPVLHISRVEMPFVVCVALGRTNGQLEWNVQNTGGKEGYDFWYFT